VGEQVTNAEQSRTRPWRCQAAVLTPPGRGAVATLVVDGPDATQAVSRLFRPATGWQLDRCPPDRVVFGYWVPHADPNAAPARGAEEVVVCRHSAERIEVHCHGGSAAVEHVLGTLAAAGCEPVPAADWVLRHSGDRLVAEARLALARARTVRAAAVLLDQHRGALSHCVAEAIEHIGAGRLDAAEQTLAATRRWSAFGQRLVQPWQVVLVGRTNAGKSSLLNTLLGYRRSLVDSAAGTTRDVLTAVTAVGGWPVEFSDTAGSRSAASELESEGIARAVRQAAAADLLVVVTDLTVPWSAEDERWVQTAAQEPVIVHNKCDLVSVIPADRPPGLVTSAVTAAGLPELLDRIAQRLVPTTPPSGVAVPFLAHHDQGLSLALQALREGRPERASRLLRELLDPCGA